MPPALRRDLYDALSAVIESRGIIKNRPRDWSSGLMTLPSGVVVLRHSDSRETAHTVADIPSGARLLVGVGDTGNLLLSAAAGGHFQPGVVLVLLNTIIEVDRLTQQRAAIEAFVLHVIDSKRLGYVLVASRYTAYIAPLVVEHSHIHRIPRCRVLVSSALVFLPGIMSGIDRWGVAARIAELADAPWEERVAWEGLTAQASDTDIWPRRQYVYADLVFLFGLLLVVWGVMFATAV